MFELLVVSCEHGGNHVPRAYEHLFAGAEALLTTHRASDLGALKVARRFADAFDAPLIAATTTRLLVDLNRSLHHRRVFSEFTDALSPAERETLVRTHYLPHRQSVAAAIRRGLDRGQRVAHLAVHSFTPELHGRVRRADVGLLYDPDRELERRLCLGWQRALRELHPALQVRRNYPYRGTSDGLATHLRRELDHLGYAGIELELNQAMLGGEATLRRAALEALIAGLRRFRSDRA